MEKQLFDYVLVVTKEAGEAPKIAYRFPRFASVKEDMVTAIPQFCFPEATTAHSNVSKKRETFSFILTQGDASKRYGYCRRFLAGDTPVCYCLLSIFLFSKLLDIVEEKHTTGSKTLVFAFLKTVLAQPFPAPGETIEVRCFSGEEEPDRYSLLRPLENSILDYVSFVRLFELVPVEHVVHLFECLLKEKRIILAANKLGVASSCVNALTGLLYPLTWQHIFIPVLPNALLAYCCAPMPFLVGAMKWSLKEIVSMPMEEVVILDCDTGDYFRTQECQALPEGLRCSLTGQLHRIMLLWRQGNMQKEDFDRYVSRCFTGVLAELLGGYAAPLSANHKEFDMAGVNATLVAEGSAKFGTSCVADLIEECQMWEVFLRDRFSLLQDDRLDTCALLKRKADPWTADSLLLKCSKCLRPVTSPLSQSKEPAVCDDCTPDAPQTSVSPETKKLQSSGSLKKKLMKRASNFSKLGKSRDDSPPSSPTSPSRSPLSSPKPSVFRGAALDAEEAEAQPQKRRASTMDEKAFKAAVVPLTRSPKTKRTTMGVGRQRGDSTGWVSARYKKPEA